MAVRHWVFSGMLLISIITDVHPALGYRNREWELMVQGSSWMCKIIVKSFWLWHQMTWALALWTWTSQLTSLRFDCLTCKMGGTLIPTARGSCEWDNTRKSFITLQSMYWIFNECHQLLSIIIKRVQLYFSSGIQQVAGVARLIQPRSPSIWFGRKWRGQACNWMFH